MTPLQTGLDLLACELSTLETTSLTFERIIVYTAVAPRETASARRSRAHGCAAVCVIQNTFAGPAKKGHIVGQWLGLPLVLQGGTIDDEFALFRVAWWLVGRTRLVVVRVA